MLVCGLKVEIVVVLSELHWEEQSSCQKEVAIVSRVPAFRAVVFWYGRSLPDGTWHVVHNPPVVDTNSGSTQRDVRIFDSMPFIPSSEKCLAYLYHFGSSSISILIPHDPPANAIVTETLQPYMVRIDRGCNSYHFCHPSRPLPQVRRCVMRAWRTSPLQKPAQHLQTPLIHPGRPPRRPYQL